jgi:hypothetical protein
VAAIGRAVAACGSLRIQVVSHRHLELSLRRNPMPLRDHFRPPISKRSSWEGFHGLWPGVIVQSLSPRLPERYVAEPRVHLGSYFEIDVCTFEENEEREDTYEARIESRGRVATATESVLAPTYTLETEFPEQYAYEVLIFDLERNRRLVAAVELVSPANKDRPESRHLFVAKCFNLLRQDVCLSIVDLVTIRRFNLYAELLAMLGHSDPTLESPPPATYAVTCRKRQESPRTKLDTWAFSLIIGQPLPSLPIWLTETQNVMLDLEASYEETCRVLRIA